MKQDVEPAGYDEVALIYFDYSVSFGQDVWHVIYTQDRQATTSPGLALYENLEKSIELVEEVITTPIHTANPFPHYKIVVLTLKDGFLE